MPKIGDTKKEKVGDDTLIWRLERIEGEAEMAVHRKRIAKIEKEMAEVEDFDEDAVAQHAIQEERKERAALKRDMARQRDKLKEIVGDD